MTEHEPKQMKIGAYVELTYTAYREYRGLIWRRTSFADGDPSSREDWVADVPHVGASVTKYRECESWSPFAMSGDVMTWEEAADREILTMFQHCESSLEELANKATLLNQAKNLLQGAMDDN